MINEFNYALSLANTLYNVEGKIEDLEEIGLIGWNLIGNKMCKLYKYTENLDPDTLSLTLPCNLVAIESVNYSYEDWKYTTNTHPNGDYNSQFVENYIETRKVYHNPLYAGGRYAKYEKVGDKLFFDKVSSLIYDVTRADLMISIFTSLFRLPAIPVLITASTPNTSARICVHIPAFTFPIPERTTTTFFPSRVPSFDFINFTAIESRERFFLLIPLILLNFFPVSTALLKIIFSSAEVFSFSIYSKYAFFICASIWSSPFITESRPQTTVRRYFTASSPQ